MIQKVMMLLFFFNYFFFVSYYYTLHGRYRKHLITMSILHLCMYYI